MVRRFPFVDEYGADQLHDSSFKIGQIGGFFGVDGRFLTTCARGEFVWGSVAMCFWCPRPSGRAPQANRPKDETSESASAR